MNEIIFTNGLVNIHKYEVNANTLAYLKLDNNGLDSGNLNYSGTTSGITYSSLNVFDTTKSSYSVQFDGIDEQNVLINRNIQHSGNTFTYSCWVKHKVIDANRQSIFSNGEWGSGLFMRAGNGLDLSVMLISWPGANIVTFTYTPLLNTWHHLCIVKTGTSITFYQDGIGQTPQTFGVDITVTGTFKLGTDRGLFVLNGYLDEFIVENRAWSSTEVSNYYNGVSGQVLGFGQVSTPIKDSSLIFNLDAGDTSSYPGTGNVWTDTTYFNKASLNGVTYGGSGSSGYLTFDGSNDYALISGSSYLSLNLMTMNIWTYSGSFNQTGYLFEKTTNGTNATQYELFLNSNNNIYFRAQGLSTTTHLTPTSTLLSGNGGGDSKWNQITVTWDGTYVKMYGNGVLGYTSSALTGSITPNSTGNAIIGAYANGAWTPGAWNLNGRLGVVQIYNRALSAGEVLQNYNGYRTRYYTTTTSDTTQYVQLFQQYVVNVNTQGYYKFDNNLLDSGPNGYNGTSGSTTSYVTGILQSNALKISGSTSALSYTNKVIPSGAKTITFWIYNKGGNENYSVILNTGYLWNVSTGTTLYITDNVNLNFQVRGGDLDASDYGLISMGAVNTLTLNEWVHIVCSWDGTNNIAGNFRIYKNGSVVASGGATKLEASGSSYNLSIGGSAAGVQASYFYLDELIIENRQWTSTEVSNYYNKIKVHQ